MRDAPQDRFEILRGACTASHPCVTKGDGDERDQAFQPVPPLNGWLAVPQPMSLRMRMLEAGTPSPGKKSQEKEKGIHLIKDEFPYPSQFSPPRSWVTLDPEPAVRYATRASIRYFCSVTVNPLTG